MNLGGLYGEGYEIRARPLATLWEYSEIFGPKPRKRVTLTREQKKKRRAIKQEAKRLREMRK